ncbi:ExeA family protein [Verrucomicrobiota bacterium]
MNYFRSLGLKRDPFGTSPDPNFLFASPAHLIALKRLEIAVKLRRGLSVIYGEVGTGKTTLSRALIRKLAGDKSISCHILLDPHYPSAFQFLLALLASFGIRQRARSLAQARKLLNDYLFETGAAEGRNIVLIIDEGQELGTAQLELLRVLLNYETNEAKLLQLVVFAQPELKAKIAKRPNLDDRVALRYSLRALTVLETSKMIDFRLGKAGFEGEEPIFTPGAVQRIFTMTGGMPRKVNMLCHDTLVNLVIQSKTSADAEFIDEVQSYRA